MKYVFNSLLLLNLSKILGVTQRDICKSYDGDPGTYVYRINHGTFPLVDLVKICNHFRIPISRFIVLDEHALKDESCLPVKDDVVWGGAWADIENRMPVFGVQFAKANGVSHKEAARMCGLSMSNFYDMFVNEKQRWNKMLVRNVIKIFNTNMVYIGEYIVDRNDPIIYIPSYRQLGYTGTELGDSTMNNFYFQKMVAKTARIQREKEVMEEEIMRLRAELKRLSDRNADER